MIINMCRLCLITASDSLKLSSLECSSGKACDMKKLIQRHIKINLRFEDHLFDLVQIMYCQSCQNMLQTWDTFLQCCAENDDKFREILTNALADAAKDTTVRNQEECFEESEDHLTEITETDESTEATEERNGLSQIEHGAEHISAEDHAAVHDLSAADNAVEALHRLPKDGVKEKLNLRSGICTICGELRKNMYEHMKTHSAIRPYTCPHCPLAFRNASNCKSHINIHTKEKIYKCDMCDKEYAMRNGLKQHLATHRKSRDYVCHCGKSFYQRTAYARHTRKHVEKPQVQCTECSMLFFSKAEMRYHFQKHTGAAFHCELCGRGFYRKSNLRKHESMHCKQNLNQDTTPSV